MTCRPGHCCRNSCAGRQMASFPTCCHQRALVSYQAKRSPLRAPRPLAWPLLTTSLMPHHSRPPLCYSNHDEPLETCQPARDPATSMVSPHSHPILPSLFMRQLADSIQRAALGPALIFCPHPRPSTAPIPVPAFRLLLQGTICPSSSPDDSCQSQHSTCSQGPWGGV